MSPEQQVARLERELAEAKRQARDSLLLDFLIIATLLFVMTLLPGCVSLGAADWRPEQHVAVMRTCKIVCYPNGVKSYDSTVGSCECYKPLPRVEESE